MEENFKKFGLNKTSNFICPFYPDKDEYLSYEDERGTVGLIAKTAESSSDDEQIRAELEGKVKSERKAETEIEEDLISNISLTSENSVIVINSETESEMSLSEGELEKERDSCLKCILSTYR